MCLPFLFFTGEVKCYLAREEKGLGFSIYDMVSTEPYEVRLSMATGFAKAFGFRAVDALFLDDTTAREKINYWEQFIMNDTGEGYKMVGLTFFKRNSGPTFRPKYWLKDKRMYVRKDQVKQIVGDPNTYTPVVLVDCFFRYISNSDRGCGYADSYIDLILQNTFSMLDLKNYLYPYKKLEEKHVEDLGKLIPDGVLNNADDVKVSKLVGTYPHPLVWTGEPIEKLMRAYHLRHMKIRMGIFDGNDYLKKIVAMCYSNMPIPAEKNVAIASLKPLKKRKGVENPYVH